MPRSHTTWALLPALLAACSSGGSDSNPIGLAAAPELLACRARVDSPLSFAEVALRSEQNLGTSRIGDKSGTERHARLHPDGNSVVFARERSSTGAASRELFTSTIDGARAELRLTQNTDLDDEPCWSPTGSSILFASDRAGDKNLWVCNADGSNPQLFFGPPAGVADGEPDWCRATDRVVFSRSVAGARATLWLLQGNGTGVVPLTDGGFTFGPGNGDHHPAFSPDGGTVAFARRFDASFATLCTCDVASGTVTTLYTPAGEIDLPRWTPTADRLFFGLAEANVGRATLRLASLPASGGTPVLAWPDERWRLHGIDFLPTMPAAPAVEAPRLLDVEQAQVQLAWGFIQSASRAQLAIAEGNEFAVFTATHDGHEVAGINVRFDLPVLLATQVAELRIRAIARTTRIGGDTALRMSIYNPVDERFDTAVELAPTNSDPVTMTFSTTSLRHVTRERQLRVTVVGEIAAGARAELRIDLIEVTLIARPNPP